MSSVRGRRSLPSLILALLVAVLLALTSGPVAAEGTVETIDTFMGGYKNASLDFRQTTENGMLWFQVPTNATILEANFTVTGEEGPIVTDDVVDFSTNAVGSGVWASTKGDKGLDPPTVDPYNNTWADIDTAGVAKIKAADGNYWHTRTPSNPTAAPWEWPAQLYHLQYDDMDNATELEVVWKGKGECSANGTFRYQAYMYLYDHVEGGWHFAQGYGSTMGRDEWMNYTLPLDIGLISPNGSVDMVILGPHANKTATASDYGHLYCDYAGLVAKVPTGRTEYPTDVWIDFNGHRYDISDGALTGSVMVGDNYGFKDHIQSMIDMQPPWANDTGDDLEVYVGQKTYATVNISDLSILYTTDGGSIPNLPPRWVGPDLMVVEEDSNWTQVVDLDAAFVDDHDQGDLVFSVEAVNVTWLQTRLGWAPGGNRTLEVKPLADAWGDANVTLSATDLDGARAVAPYLEVHVSPVPDAPTIVPPSVMNAVERVPFRTTVLVDDPDLPADYLSFSDDSELFDINATDGTIDWTPTPPDIGTHTCTITVTDFLGLSDSVLLTIQVANVNDAPVITSVDRIEADEGDRVTYQVVATDDDIVHGDELTYTAWSIHSEVHMDASTGAMWFQLERGTVGAVQVLVMAQDAQGATAQLTLVVDVANVNDPPTIDPAGPFTYNEGAQVELRLSFDDPDAHLDLEEPEALTITTNGPEWLSADLQGWVRFTAEQAHVGEHLVTYEVEDREGLSASTEVMWKVVNLNDDPVITTEVPLELSASEGEAFLYTLAASDEDGDTLIWSDDTDLFDIDPVTGTISFTPGQDDVGQHPVTVTVEDSSGSSASVTFGLVVKNVNDAPLISSVLPLDGSTFSEGQIVRFSVDATDPDGDRLSILWFEDDVELGTGSPFSTRSLKVGTHSVVLVVTDGTESVQHELEVVVKASDDGSGEAGVRSPVLMASIVLIAASCLLVAYVVRGRGGGPDGSKG
jgi:hypothetical protein